MMINNAGDVFQLCIYHKKKTKASQPVKIKAKASAYKYACYINDILNDS